MESILPTMFVVLICLACPLGMALIGGVAWLIGRTKSSKSQGPAPGSMQLSNDS